MPGDPIILALTKCGSIYGIKNIEVLINILSEGLATPRKMANDPAGVATLGLKTTVLRPRVARKPDLLCHMLDKKRQF